MKKIILVLILAPALLFMTSCHKNNNVEPTDNGMSSLVVPADFNWKTQQTLDVVIQLPSEGELQQLFITNYDGSKVYFSGYPEDGSRTLRTKITIPTYVTSVRLIYNGATGPNVAYINNFTVAYDFNTKTKSSKTPSCNLEGLITYSKGGWGQTANGNNVGTLRDTYFDQVYATDFVIGYNNGYTVTFNESSDVATWSFPGGGPKVLSQSWVNPPEKKKLGNMADQIIAARLNRDFNAAGYLGSNPDYTLGELVYMDGPFEGMTVNAFLEMAETALGGGSMNGHSASDYATAAEHIIFSFHEGTYAGYLTCPENPEEDDPYVEVSSTCLSSEVVFTIINNGDGDMTSAYEYTVFKNGDEVASGTYQLDVNETLDITTSGLNTDEFSIEVETPREETLEDEITGCGSGGGGGGGDDDLAGTLAFEDLWPGMGDYDFNDLVIDYEFVITKDNQEVVENIEVTFEIRAYGASLHNGFAFTLPNVEPEDITSVTGYDVASSSVFNIDSKGLESGQSKATIVVFDDVRRVMPQTTGGIGVNTQEEYDYIDPVTMVINIDFADNAITYADLDIGSFNPFIIVGTTVNGALGSRGKEVHLPDYLPSDLMDDTYFDTQDDATNPATGKYFVTANNLPWAINIAEDFDWVIEFQDITGAYLHFGEWAESGGTNYNDWYQDGSGYRNNSLIYTVPSGK